MGQIGVCVVVDEYWIVDFYFLQEVFYVLFGIDVDFDEMDVFLFVLV